MICHVCKDTVQDFVSYPSVKQESFYVGVLKKPLCYYMHLKCLYFEQELNESLRCLKESPD